ncbi:MAG: DNA repair protein RadC [Desulfobacterales bacterium]|nr:DNA repair protein RadC [Desulfobacterales bacterium]
MTQRASHKGEGHRLRLRDRFMQAGLSGFHDYEVVELLLTLGTPRKDCKDMAKAILKRFKTLPGVFEAPNTALCEIDGLGLRNIIGLKLVKAVADRYLEDQLLHRDPIHNAKALFDYLYHRLRARHRECFEVIFLDARNKVMETQTLFEGTLTASAVYPREVVHAALNQNAAALIFVHNHPSGDPAPSPEDIDLTRRLLFACKVSGITVHEHLIIGDNCYYSFAEQGHIARMNAAYEKI